MPAQERGFSPPSAIIEKPAAPSPRAQPPEIIVPLQPIKLQPQENAIKRNADLFAQTLNKKPESGERAKIYTSEMKRLRKDGHTTKEIDVFVGNAMAHLEGLAEKDPLTELYSRKGIERRFGEIVSRTDRTNEKVSIAMIDLDKFKYINDNHGHPTGDDVLYHTANYLQYSGRRNHIFGRHGGEEFIAILPGTTIQQGVEAMERQRIHLSKSVDKALKEKSDRKIQQKITVSIGVAEYDPQEYKKKFGSRQKQINKILRENGIVLDTLTPEEQIIRLREAEEERTKNILAYITEKADKALYAAKDRGRNRVVALIPDEYDDDILADMRNGSLYLENKKGKEEKTVYSRIRI